MRWLLPTIAIIAIYAQTPAPPAFEVASIKPGDLETLRQGRGALARSDPGQVTFHYLTVKHLIMRAYDVKIYQIDAPGWVDNQFYDVVAKIPAGASQDQMPAMLQTLLAERFGLKVHRESKSQAVYALLVGKNGLKIKLSDLTVLGADGKPRGRTMSFNTFGHFEFRRNTMAEFAQAMSGNLGRPVIDRTGLDGKYDIDLDINPSDLQGSARAFTAAGGSPPADNADVGSVFTAIDALGLKLESTKAPIEHIVVDRVLKTPTEN